MERDQWFRGYSDFAKAKIIRDLLCADGIRDLLCAEGLPVGHVIIEQAEMQDGTGRVSQTVVVAGSAEEYERIVHVDEAYGADV
jgi:hypothetical protein